MTETSVIIAGEEFKRAAPEKVDDHLSLYDTWFGVALHAAREVGLV